MGEIIIMTRCRKCGGSGEMTCKYCGGDGYNAYGGQCQHCYGTGEVKCTQCNGTGEVEKKER